MSDQGGLFKELYRAIRKVKFAYGELEDGPRRRLSAKGFSKGNMNSLDNIAEKLEGVMVVERLEKSFLDQKQLSLFEEK